MKSAYVKTAYVNVSDSDKASTTKIVSLSDGDLFRLFHVEFQLADPDVYSSCGLVLCNRNSSDAAYQFYKDQIYSSYIDDAASPEPTYFLKPMRIGSHGVQTKCTGDGIYFTGLGVGVNFVSISYQVGSQA